VHPASFRLSSWNDLTLSVHPKDTPSCRVDGNS
jgi:hypothetical protein